MNNFAKTSNNETWRRHKVSLSSDNNKYKKTFSPQYENRYNDELNNKKSNSGSKRDPDLPKTTPFIKHKTDKTISESPNKDKSHEIAKLKALITKLEKKSEDRKLSLKQLFAILTIKEKELNKWKEIVPKIKESFVEKTKSITYDMGNETIRIEDHLSHLEAKFSAISEKIIAAKFIKQRGLNNDRRLKI